MRHVIAEDRIVESIQTEEKGCDTSIPSPQVMKECSMSPSRVSTSIHGLLNEHSTYIQSRDTLTTSAAVFTKKLSTKFELKY